MKEADTIYAAPLERIVDFRFDENVARVFADMINRSVPGYANLIAMIGLIGARFVQPDSQVYDLGCSLGAVSLALRRQLRAENTRIIAVDNSESMVARCRENLARADEKAGQGPHVDVCLGDIREVEVRRASVVILNLTLQFVPLQERPALLKRIYQGMLPGGVLIISEKLGYAESTNVEDTHQILDGQVQQVQDTHPASSGHPASLADEVQDTHQFFGQLFEQLHLDFKRANGYSELEISQKRSALEKVLIPETEAAHHARLREAGFARVDTWFQCLNFASVLAIK